MKHLKNIVAVVAVLLFSMGLSSCYVGLYGPGPRYGGPRYRPAGPRYYSASPARHYHHGYNRGHGRR